MAETLISDPIMTEAQAQQWFDQRDTDERVRLINGLTQKARAYLNRTVIAQDLTTAVEERYRPEGESSSLFLRAAAFVDGTHDLSVAIQSGATEYATYTYAADQLVVTSDDFGTRVDLISGTFPGCTGNAFSLLATYYAGWATTPADVLNGAIMQGRIDLKRLAGEVGMESHSRQGESSRMDRGGVIGEVQDLWDPYVVWAW